MPHDDVPNHRKSKSPLVYKPRIKDTTISYPSEDWYKALVIIV